MKLQSRPPGWCYVMILAGVLTFVVLAAIVQKTAVSDAWPFCDECTRTARRRRLVGAALGAAGLAVVGGLLLLTDSVQFTVWFFGILGGLLAAMAGVIVAVGSWRAVTGAVVSEDGQWVTVARAHPDFAEQVAAHAAAVEAKYGAPAPAIG